MKELFKKYGITQNVRNWEQYNYGLTEEGLKIFKEREKLAKKGIIKITCKMLNPKLENNCVYWEEMHYPKITADKILALESMLDAFSYMGYDKTHRYKVWRGSIQAEINSNGKTRVEALSSLLIKLHEHFTEYQQKKIKRILKN